MLLVKCFVSCQTFLFSLIVKKCMSILSSYRSQGACVSDMINMLVSGTYYAAVIENCTDFVGRVVVDVGAGSGILSLFAAQVA